MKLILIIMRNYHFNKSFIYLWKFLKFLLLFLKSDVAWLML